MEEERIPNAALAGLIGKRVEVRSNTGDDDCQDEGILEAFDYPWIRLNKGQSQILCFPVHNVRLIKLLERYQPPPPTPANTLLRPATRVDVDPQQLLRPGHADDVI